MTFNSLVRTFAIAVLLTCGGSISHAAVTNYIIFFDSGSAALIPAGLDVVTEAAQTYRATRATRIEVVGHTDTAEATSLSNDRARTIRDELVRLGVPASDISADGRGASEPMAPTAAGIREPMNRRATITLKGDR